MNHHTQISTIVRGIKTIGVGKKGSRSMDTQLATEVFESLKKGEASDAAKGAFIGALVIKGISEEERVLEQLFKNGAFNNPQQLIEQLDPQIPPFVKDCCIQILNKKTIDLETAYQLGKFLFSEAPGDTARGLIASILRVRYETDDEYEGLLKALNETFTPEFKTPPPDGLPIIQLADPFDGVDHSNIITPLLAQYLQTLNYRVVSLCGRSGGPKLCYNLLDIARLIPANIVASTQDIIDNQQNFGYFLNQELLSPAMDRWVDIRRQTIKRPFMATLERFVNPVRARIIGASAFHPPYGEKMMTVCERARFQGIIIIRNGIEGSTAFPLLRNAKILCSARQSNGSYLRNEIQFDAQEFLNESVPVEERLEQPDLKTNAELINQYIKNKKTHNHLFDLRVQATCEGFRQAIEWIEKNIRHTDGLILKDNA